jgi:glutathione S-transferase
MKLKLIIGNKNYSSWSLRPWLAMKEFGVDFEEIRIPLYLPESPAQIKQYSPSGKVPALLDDKLSVWDSLAIVEYLAEKFPDLNWWPQEKMARSIARSISAEMHSGFANLRQNMPMNCRARYPGKGMTPELAKEIERITAIWSESRQQFGAGGEMLFGNFSIADAMYAPVVMRFITYGVDLNPVCQSYADAIVSLPAMQEWLEAAKVETQIMSAYEFE